MMGSRPGHHPALMSAKLNDIGEQSGERTHRCHDTKETTRGTVDDFINVSLGGRGIIEDLVGGASGGRGRSER
jgi:hypothetical protein